MNAQQYIPTGNDAAIYSDMYKDVYGSRPRGGSFEFESEADFDATMHRLQEEVNEQIDQDARNQAAALAELEAQLDQMVADFGIDRSTAMRWILDAEEEADDYGRYDIGYWCWKRGIAYSEEARIKELAGV